MPVCIRGCSRRWSRSPNAPETDPRTPAGSSSSGCPRGGRTPSPPPPLARIPPGRDSGCELGGCEGLVGVDRVGDGGGWGGVVVG